MYGVKDNVTKWKIFFTCFYVSWVSKNKMGSVKLRYLSSAMISFESDLWHFPCYLPDLTYVIIKLGHDLHITISVVNSQESYKYSPKFQAYQLCYLDPGFNGSIQTSVSNTLMKYFTSLIHISTLFNVVYFLGRYRQGSDKISYFEWPLEDCASM